MRAKVDAWWRKNNPDGLMLFSSRIGNAWVSWMPECPHVCKPPWEGRS